MKLKHMVGIALAGAFVWSAAASATPAWKGAWNGYEVRTPSSVNESAPWLANEPHMAVYGNDRFTSHRARHSSRSVDHTPMSGTGTSASVAGSGSVGFDSNQASSTSTTEYWLLGAGTTTAPGDASLGAPMTDSEVMMQ
jgi:hypothetical protein